MTTNKPVPFCVEFCELVRSIEECRPSSELGSGLLEVNPFDDLELLIQDGIQHLFRNGVAMRFGLTSEDVLTEELTQTLTTVLHDDSLSATDLVLTDGVTHGLSCLFDYCQQRGIGVLLPLPCYFGYELSALHSGVEIAGYYEPAGTSIHWLSTHAPVCLVVNTPDALTGGVLALGQIGELRTAVGPRLRLTVFDLICAMHGYSTTSDRQLRVRDIWRLRDHSPTILLLGVTKDLAIPGFRAGVIIGSDREAVTYSRDSIFARSFSASVVVGVVMLVYCRLLAALEAEDLRQVHAATSAPQLPLRSRVFSRFTEDTVLQFLAQRRQLDALFTEALEDLSDHFGGELILPLERHQHVGYSAMASLRGGLRGLDKIVEASQALLRQYHLRVNPSYMFGGNPHLWETLYPGQLHLRLNLSTPVDILRDQVRAALSYFAS